MKANTISGGFNWNIVLSHVQGFVLTQIRGITLNFAQHKHFRTNSWLLSLVTQEWKFLFIDESGYFVSSFRRTP